MQLALLVQLVDDTYPTQKGAYLGSKAPTGAGSPSSSLPHTDTINGNLSAWKMVSEKTTSIGVTPEQVQEPVTSICEPAKYSSFSSRQKNVIIGLAAFAGWFSSVSSFIYFPAIPNIASSLDQSTENINLTVTSYLIVSGVIPSIVGNAADRFGRRPVVLIALTVYLGANIGLALQSSFALLFFFRMVQSAGISGTFCITYGVLGDLFTPAERGGYSGTVSLLYVQTLDNSLVLQICLQQSSV